MQNQSNSLKTKVNSIVDYFDQNYEIETAGTDVGLDGTPNGNLKDKVKWDSYNSQYKKATITNNTEIEAGKEQSIYVQFKLDRSKVAQILTGKQEGEKAEQLLNNVAEINSYSIYDDNGIYAGIDKDSNPGNSIPGQINTYEDDTDSAPTLRLEVANAREMAGKVFVDNHDTGRYGGDPSGIMTGIVRQGNGQYDTGEETVGGVEVTLRENKENGQEYKTKTIENVAPDGKYGFKKEDDIITPEPYQEGKDYEYTYNNSENDYKLNKGDFYIQSYIPGDYKLTYTWGDTEHTVQNYKGTVYDSMRNQEDKQWWKTWKIESVKDGEEWKEQKIEIGVRNKTDAIDNYNNNQEAPKGSRIQIDEEIKNVSKNTHTTITTMDSTTPTMGIGVEYESAYSSSRGNRYSYMIDDIDFGIIERAKQDLVLTKRIKSMKVTLANGQVIADLTIDEEGNTKEVNGEKKGITYMQPQENITPQNGFIRLELDNELIQGTKLEVTYEIKATNNSELDYIPKEGEDATFYKYGIVNNNQEPITITPAGIVDYLDKNWAFDSENYKTTWQVKVANDDKNDKSIEKYVIEDVLDSSKGSTIAEKMILYTEKLKDSKLVPKNAKNATEGLKQSDQVELNVSKILTTTDEISLENEAEEVKVTRDGGRTLETIPGNYIPGSASISRETDNSMAETAIVTPATGEDLNYILPIIIGTTALIILGVGIIIIKKKVL